MSKPKKNQQKGKSGIRLQDVVLQYKLKNYGGALKRLRTADLKSGEEQQAKKLEYAILMRLALTEMSDSNYQNALKYLLPLTPSDIRASAFAGVAYLYLLDYKSAIPLLRKAAATHPFIAFYHILAELYLQKEVDFEAFTDFYKREWQYCTESQKQYIRMIAHCFDNNIEEAAQMAIHLKSQSHFQHLNFEGFKSLLLQTPLSIETGSDKLKPLYRLATQNNLTYAEKTYFQQFENTVPALSPLLKSQSNITPHLQKEIEAQYQHEKLLDEETLAAVMQGASVEQRPYIAYNQAVNAHNQEYFEDAEKGIKHVIVRYADDFVQIPESLAVYLEIYKDNNTKPYPATFWQFVNRWLSIRKGNVTVENLDEMGWTIFDILFKHSSLVDLHFRKELSKMSAQYPSVFALKFAEITFPYRIPTDNQWRAACMDLLSLPNAEKNKAKFIEQIDFLLTHISYDSPLNDILHVIPKEVFIKQVVDFATCFMTSVTDFKIPPQNTIALEAFRCVHQYIKQILDHNDKLPQGFYEKFTKTYNNLIQQFETHPDIQIYKRDIQAAENTKYIAELQQLTKYISKPNDFLRFLKKHPDITDFGFVWAEFEKMIDKTHFEDSVAECLVNFIEALFIYQKNEKTTAREIAHFMQKFGHYFQKHACEHPTAFYGMMVKYIVNRTTLSVPFIYGFVVYHIEELTQRHKLEPKQYNAVADFLEFLITNRLTQLIKFDGTLIKKLRDYLTGINKSKKLKKIEATLKKAIVL